MSNPHAHQPVEPDDLPILIYCPGIGHGEANTADRVAAVIAGVIDRHRQGTFRATREEITAPPGLIAGSNVIDDDTRKPILHVLELDYRRRLESTGAKSRPPVSPGVVQSAKYAIAGVFLLFVAFATFNRAKGLRAKLQLLYALAGALLLVFAAAVAILSALAAAHVAGFSHWTSWLGVESAKFAAIAGGVSVVSWTAVRRRLLAWSTVIQRLMRYMTEARFRDTVAQTLDDAVDGLRDNGWTGPIHVLAYSFGSLIALDALFPLVRGLGPNDRVTESVASLTTIACPVDAVRLLMPWYFDDQRYERMRGRADWYNVFSSRDVFATNFSQLDPNIAGTAEQPPKDSSPTIKPRGKYISIAARRPIPFPFGPDDFGPIDFLTGQGFSAHDAYWGERDEASCFSAELVRHWVPQ